MKDQYAEVGADGFTVVAPLYRAGHPFWPTKPRVEIAWDQLGFIDGSFLKRREDSVGESALSIVSGSGSLMDWNPRGYLRLTFFLRETPNDPIYADLPRSLMWRPDQPWLDGFLADARRAIAEPAHRAVFDR